VALLSSEKETFKEEGQTQSAGNNAIDKRDFQRRKAKPGHPATLLLGKSHPKKENQIRLAGINVISKRNIQIKRPNTSSPDSSATRPEQ
jgi:hypothetical protein